MDPREGVVRVDLMRPSGQGCKWNGIVVDVVFCVGGVVGAVATRRMKTMLI